MPYWAFSEHTPRYTCSWTAPPPARKVAMNHESIDLEPLCVERVQVKEVLKALIHSIIFQRALGAPLYRDTESDLFDITYMRCDSHLIDSKVEELAEAFSSGIDADAAADVRTTCLLYTSPSPRD